MAALHAVLITRPAPGGRWPSTQDTTAVVDDDHGFVAATRLVVAVGGCNCSRANMYGFLWAEVKRVFTPEFCHSCDGVCVCVCVCVCAVLFCLFILFVLFVLFCLFVLFVCFFVCSLLLFQGRRSRRRCLWHRRTSRMSHAAWW